MRLLVHVLRGANISVRARLLRASGGHDEARIGANAQIERAPLRALIDARKPEAGVAVGGEREAVCGACDRKHAERNEGTRESE